MMSSAARGITGGRALVCQLRAVVGNDASTAVAAAVPRYRYSIASISPIRNDHRGFSSIVLTRRAGWAKWRLGIRQLSDARKAAQEGSTGDEKEGEQQAEGEAKASEGGEAKASEGGEAKALEGGEAGEEEAPALSHEEELEAQVKDLKDQLLRSLAEQENTRRIAKRDVDAAKSYAVTSFAKSLLDTSDNLARALEAVPPEYRQDNENHPVLATLYEGIKMTDENLTRAFAKNGLTKFGEVGEQFDPNLHDALFEYPDPEKEEGTVGQVMKIGFMLNKRVVRPAEVGVIKKT